MLTIIDSVFCVNHNSSLISINKKKGLLMSIGSVIIALQGIYIAADSRSSRVNENFEQLSFNDDYQKVVPSQTGKYILLSTGLNDFTEQHKTVSDIVKEVDEWIIANHIQSLHSIAQHISHLIYSYVCQTYKEKMKNCTDNKELAEKMIVNTSATMTVAGYIAGCPYVFYNEFIPTKSEDEMKSTKVLGRILTYGIEQEYARECLENIRLDCDDTTIVNSIREIFNNIAKKDIFVGGQTVVYKISLIDGKECIIKLA